MGCGILFPHDYDSEVDSDLSPDENDSPDLLRGDDDSYLTDSSEDEDFWGEKKGDNSGTKVQVSCQTLKGFSPAIIMRMHYCCVYLHAQCNNYNLFFVFRYFLHAMVRS